MEAAGDRPATLARRAGVASSAVSQALGGESIGPKTVAALAVALGIEPEALIRIQ